MITKRKLRQSIMFILKKNEAELGFTLIEVLVSTLIVGMILSSIFYTIGFLNINLDRITVNHKNYESFIRTLSVIEQDLNSGLKNLNDGGFDTVLMTQTLQSLRYPHLVLDEMLRIGDQAIITFPNFGHWRTRASLLFNGRMPVTKQLSYQWYDTPNIHFFTYKDFETLCVERKIKIVGRVFVGGYSSTLGMDRVWPNLFAQTAIYRLRK